MPQVVIADHELSFFFRHVQKKPANTALYSFCFQTDGNKISPLVVNPGKIVLSTVRLYFQPYNNAEDKPVIKVRLASIKRIFQVNQLLCVQLKNNNKDYKEESLCFQRRYLLRPLGLEIEYTESKSGRTEHRT